MTLTFDDINKIITVDSPDVEITIQDLHNGIVEYEDELVNLDLKRIVSSGGKESLGSGVSVGITLTLLNDWRLAFEDRAGPTWTQCVVSGGNLVSTNVNGAIYPTAFVTVTIAASSSATIAESSVNPWTIPVSGNTGAGTFGEMVGNKLLKFTKWLSLK